MASEPEERLLTPGEVATIFNVETKTVARWARDGVLPYVRTLGGHHRYPEKQIHELAQAQDDHLLTPAQVAAIFKVDPTTVTKWAKAGKLPHTKTLGGHRRYSAKLITRLARGEDPSS